METISLLIGGFEHALTPGNLVLAVVGSALGTIIGALPGLGPANGVALLIPLAFALGLPATPALILMTSVYYGAMYGGRISSILLNMPGDEPALMTTLDGYPMAKQGRAGEALALSGIASFVGGLLATIGLVIAGPLLAEIAFLFGPAENFALYTMAFATLAGLAANNQAKAIFAAGLGLSLSMIGLDGLTGTSRFTMGEMRLMEGIDFLVAIVGLFAIAEVLLFLEHRGRESAIGIKVGRITAPLKTIRLCGPTMLRGTGIGFIAGVLPGAGASLGSFLAYALEKRVSDRKGTFGKGDPRGVAAPEAGNNAAAGGALIPMLTLGIPGSGTTAVMLALLMTLNITPGPLLFAEKPDLVWGLIAALFISNFVLLIMNIPMVGIFVRLLRVPSHILMPTVAMVAFAGIYSISGSMFDILLMVGFGILGYILRKLGIPTVPIILGILLGNRMENSLRRALTISNGDWSVLLGSPIAIGLWTLALIGFIAPLFFGHVLRARRARAVARADIEAEEMEPD